MNEVICLGAATEKNRIYLCLYFHRRDFAYSLCPSLKNLYGNCLGPTYLGIEFEIFVLVERVSDPLIERRLI